MKKIKVDAGRLQLNKTKIADLNQAQMELVNGGAPAGNTTGIGVNPRGPVVPSVPYYVTCRNCNPQTNSVSCCDGV